MGLTKGSACPGGKGTIEFTKALSPYQWREGKKGTKGKNPLFSLDDIKKVRVRGQNKNGRR